MERMISAGVRLVHEGAVTVLRPGDAVTFGRNAAAQDPPSGRHVGLGADSALHAHAGTLAWADGGCVVTNTGRWLRLRLTEIGGPGRADLDPGRALRIPWRRTRVEIATGSTITGFEVDLGPLEPSQVEPNTAGDTVAALDLDRTSGYFRALVALCEPRLRDPSTDEVATAARIALRLNALPDEPEKVTPKAVERRLAHARRRVGVGGTDPSGVSAAGLEVRDAGRQLADLALRTGTVTTGDLALLDPRRGRSAPGPTL